MSESLADRFACWQIDSREDVVASLMAFKAAEEADLGEDGGFTISAARSRTGAGVFLAALVAVAIAEETGSPVRDEVLLLKLDRHIQPGDARAQMKRWAGTGDLRTIGRRFADRLGLSLPI